MVTEWAEYFSLRKRCDLQDAKKGTLNTSALAGPNTALWARYFLFIPFSLHLSYQILKYSWPEQLDQMSTGSHNLDVNEYSAVAQ